MDFLGTFGSIASILGLILTIILLWRKINSFLYNAKCFRNGGVRIIFHSGAYTIRTPDLNGKVIYQSSKRSEDYILYRSMTMLEKIEKIPPFRQWEKKYWADDIRKAQYPLEFLNKG